jgi:hypothetical protein
MASLRGGERAVLHGLTRSVSWGGVLGAATACGVLLQWAQGAWLFRPFPRRGVGFLFKDLVDGILVVGAGGHAVGGVVVLVGAGDCCCCWWWCAAPCSTAGDFFGLVLVVVVSL